MAYNGRSALKAFVQTFFIQYCSSIGMVARRCLLACLPALPTCLPACSCCCSAENFCQFRYTIDIYFFLLSIFFVLLFMSLSSILSSLFSVFSIRLYYSGAYIYFPVVGVVGCCWLLFCFILYPLCTTIFILYTQSYLHAFIFENSKNIM